MTKADLIDKIAANANLTKAAAERVLNAFLASLESALVKDAKLTITGFGTFLVEERKARQGRNPRTGESLTIPACKVLKFRPGKCSKTPSTDSFPSLGGISLAFFPVPGYTESSYFAGPTSVACRQGR